MKIVIYEVLSNHELQPLIDVCSSITITNDDGVNWHTIEADIAGMITIEEIITVLDKVFYTNSIEEAGTNSSGFLMLDMTAAL